IPRSCYTSRRRPAPRKPAYSLPDQTSGVTLALLADACHPGCGFSCICRPGAGAGNGARSAAERDAVGGPKEGGEERVEIERWRAGNDECVTPRQGVIRVKASLYRNRIALAFQGNQGSANQLVQVRTSTAPQRQSS